MFDCKNLDEFFGKYGDTLGKKARELLAPLHVPGRDEAKVASLLRPPFDAQSHVVTACVKQLRRDKTALLVAQMGTGKTFMSMAVCHTHAALGGGKGYRALVVCPGHLTEKWARELRETIPGVRVQVVEDWRQLLPAVRQWQEGKRRYLAQGQRNREHPQLRPLTREDARRASGLSGAGPVWYVLGKDRAKLSAGWEPVVTRRSVRGRNGNRTYWRGGREDEGCCRCPRCGKVLVDKHGENLGLEHYKGRPRKPRRVCKFYRDAEGVVREGCKEQLWQEVGKPRRHAPARLIRKHLKGFFDYLVLDEAHDYKGADSVQADAVGAIASACKKVIALTGTLVGGYAWHIRTLLLRLGAGRTMLQDGYGWNDEMKFNQAFGRVETKETISPDEGPTTGRAYARGGDKVTRRSYARPGIMPTMFKHLVGNSVFLSLDDVAANLPLLKEEVVPVDMDPELRPCYDVVNKALTDEIKTLARKGNKKLLGTMLNCLLCYPDYPYDWSSVGYWMQNEDSLSDQQVWREVCRPQNLDPQVQRAKEEALVRTVLGERLQGRQVWVYCTYTDKRDCIARLEAQLRQAGLRTAVLRAKVEPAQREAWIDRHGPGADVVLSHPDLVKTGLDFFNKRTGHNFVTICFYQCGYNLFTLRQAAARAWRIGQRRECRVYYFFYADSMQSRAMDLMGRKIQASNSLEGKFSTEGLAAMAGDDESLEVALAKTIDQGMKDEAVRSWAKLTGPASEASRFGLESRGDTELADLLAGFESLSF